MSVARSNGVVDQPGAALNEVYLDFAASTPCDPMVIAAMLPYFAEYFGNPSNLAHGAGRQAHAAVETAREQAAGLVGCRPDEVVWTSGATEANNLALLGAVRAWSRARGGTRAHVITASTEHPSVLAPFRQLEQDGHRVAYVQPGGDGVVTASSVAGALLPSTCLVSLMMVNNELGTLNEVGEVAALCRERGILIHCDATQAVGHVPIRLLDTPLDLICWSGHKIYGPKGVGVLVRRTRSAARIEPLVRGGGQESGLRSGTLNVPGIVGLGAAAETCRGRMTADAEHIGALRTRLETILRANVPHAVVNGGAATRAPHIANISFPGGPDDDLVDAIVGVACASGSACESQDRQPSHVLRSIGVHGALARNTLRLSLGRTTSTADVDTATKRVLDALRRRGQLLRSPD